ncbi:MAG TPA: dienelactone hydrolase family protein [Stellaceae bacterium]
MPDVTIRAKDGGQFSAYLATPKSGRGPGIVVIQEIFGVNPWVRQIADRCAAMGYVAMAPDLFWRQEPGIQLTDQTKEDWGKAFKLMEGLNQAKAVEDIQATIDALRGNPACTGKVGAVGYCLGGRLAYMTATGTDADAAVGYYGVALDGLVGNAGKITHPLMLHIAEKDQFVSADVQAKVHAALDGNQHVTLHDYAGQDHAFARDGGEHFDQAAATLANDRTAAFFKQNLA